MQTHVHDYISSCHTNAKARVASTSGLHHCLPILLHARYQTKLQAFLTGRNFSRVNGTAMQFFSLSKAQSYVPVSLLLFKGDRFVNIGKVHTFR